MMVSHRSWTSSIFGIVISKCPNILLSRTDNKSKVVLNIMARDEHQVIHNPNGEWDVKRNNAQQASLHTETKAEAVKAGRQISRNQRTEFVVHGMNGRIQNPDSHGNDPCPPRDRK